MKKEIFIHYSFLISLFIFISLAKGWMSLSYWPLWIGGIFGNILPDLDHFIYVYFLKPHELTSQRVGYMMGKRNLSKSFRLLAETRSERTKLVFHSGLFQLVFIVLAFLVVTSSGSLFSRGVVLAFFLHLLVDQAVDLVETGNMDNWTGGYNFEISENQAKVYWSIMFLVLLLLSFVL
ncbi:hypothetical protein KKH23_02665 [Patescibacteria group bacterium]|nr:hypothetical protein [Patescibacteria group bacterium]MBU0777441.1 hypothetical protein [Patescibacteria group bacterium]MBU0846076.1 hypothetical protein [Patescibacteria group bacterium]MBU0923129.1 hypothetical protein [Patescibacteria group bacterium]MBU1066844.1 hypothetical protein [Patescibacteria group bacterium]